MGFIVFFAYAAWAIAIPETFLGIIPVHVATNFFTAIPLWLTSIPALIYNLATGTTFQSQEYLYMYVTGTASYFIKKNLGDSYGWLISLLTFLMAPFMWLFSVLTSFLLLIPGIIFILFDLISSYFIYGGHIVIPLFSVPALLALIGLR